MNAMNTAISKIGVVPVIKLNHPERDAANLGKALCAGGVGVAEITFRAAGADIAIKLMKEACPEMIVGAGTVTNTEQIDKVIAAGGEFIVTPGFDPELVAYAQEKNIPIFPGCTTASRLCPHPSPSSRSCPPAAFPSRTSRSISPARSSRPAAAATWSPPISSTTRSGTRSPSFAKSPVRSSRKPERKGGTELWN